jgi:hypothetical protein
MAKARPDRRGLGLRATDSIANGLFLGSLRSHLRESTADEGQKPCPATVAFRIPFSTRRDGFDRPGPARAENMSARAGLVEPGLIARRNLGAGNPSLPGAA